MKPKFDYENFCVDTYIEYIKYLHRKKKKEDKKHDSKGSIRRDKIRRGK